MSLKRHDGMNWVDITQNIRHNGTDWQSCDSVKKHDGSNWVDVWGADGKRKASVIYASNSATGAPMEKYEYVANGTEATIKAFCNEDSLSTYGLCLGFRPSDFDANRQINFSVELVSSSTTIPYGNTGLVFVCHYEGGAMTTDDRLLPGSTPYGVYTRVLTPPGKPQIVGVLLQVYGKGNDKMSSVTIRNLKINDELIYFSN